MGTVARLRKIAREDAKKLGHELGYLRKINAGEYILVCVNCGLYITIFTTTKSVNITEVTLGLFGPDRKKHKDFRHNMSYGSSEYKTGRKLSEVHPPRSKGTIRGRALSEECKHNFDQNADRCPAP